MKILCTADLHLGRQPSRIPDDLADLRSELTPAAVWRRTVDLAIDEGVDAVLIAGDVVEQNDDFYEALPDLRAGTERLAGAGIRVLGIAGNHDVHVLPRLADAVDAFELIGRGGEWDVVTLEDDEGRELDVLGWSFPDERVSVSPLADLPSLDAARTTIGLLHCDLDQTGSPYAPVRSADLRAAPVAAWLLGHIHKPSITQTSRPIGYLGSPVGVDPGEAGAHGVWMLELTDRGEIEFTSLPVAPLRWEELEVDVSAVEDPHDLPLRISEALEELHDQVASAEHELLAVGCRLRVVGRSNLRRDFRAALMADDPSERTQRVASTRYFIHRWHLEVQPDRDLETLAEGSDMVGLLARDVLELRDPESERRADLIERAGTRLRGVAEQRPYRGLGSATPSDEDVARILESSAIDALDRLLEQREEAA